VTDTSPEDPSAFGKPRGRRERKKLDTRRKIFRAAFELFTAKGFDSTTVEEIAERADVAKGTVFNYFPQKSAFLVAAYQEWVMKLVEELGPVESWEGPARAQLGRLFDFLTDLGAQHRPLALQVVFENMRQSHLRLANEETRKAQAEQDHEAVRLLEIMARTVVRRGKDRSEVRPEVDDAQAASLIAAATFHTLVRGLIRGDGPGEIKTAMGTKLDIIFTGLVP